MPGVAGELGLKSGVCRADLLVVGELLVARWSRYGKDRLYVSAPDGSRIGWRDLVSGENHIERATHAEEFRRVVGEWLGCKKTGGREANIPSTQAAQAAPEPRHPVAIAHWEDLATQRAGAMAREQAIAMREAAPVRTAIARILGAHTDERAWRIGADGEEKVAAQLARLAKKDPRWRFLHAIPVGEGGCDIDHIVIGPGGVFTLNAKHHPNAKIWVGGNTFMVNGTRTQYVRKSRCEAARADRLLSAASRISLPVTGVIVPVGAGSLTIKSQPDGVHVVNRMALVDWFRGTGAVLPEHAVRAIFEVARRSTTWRPARS